jgi:hypothetical protein
MGSFHEYFDVAGGVRSGLQDDPPWWAPGAIAGFAVVALLVLGVSLALGVGGDPPAGSPRRQPAALPPGTARAEPVAPGAPTEARGDARQADTGTLALADRTGTFQQVPRAAVTAARGYAAGALGIPVDELRHQLISVAPGRVELTLSSLDDRRRLRVVALAVDGSWQAA